MQEAPPKSVVECALVCGAIALGMSDSDEVMADAHPSTGAGAGVCAVRSKSKRSPEDAGAEHVSKAEAGGKKRTKTTSEVRLSSLRLSSRLFSFFVSSFLRLASLSR